MRALPLTKGFTKMNQPLILHAPEAPVVEIDATGITARNVRLQDRPAAEFLSSFEEEHRGNVLIQGAILGLHSLQAGVSNGTVIAMTDQVQAAAKAAGDHVDAATQAMQRTITTIVERYCAEDGVIATNLRKVGSEVLDPDKAETLVRLRERIGKDIQLVFEPLARQLKETVNVNDETKPFGQMAREIRVVRESLTAIKSQLDGQAALVAAGRGNANYVGRSLEDFCLGVLGEVAAHQGETLEDVRNAPGLIERSKAGDHVTTIDGRFTPGATVKVAIEDKNRQKATLTGLLRELDGAMANRGADVGLGVLVNPNAPPIFYQHNKVVVNLSDFGSSRADYGLYAELLRVGYDMARFTGIAAARNAHHEPAIDLHAIDKDVDDLSKIAGMFSTLKDNHTRIESAVGNARETAEKIREQLVASASCLRTRITEALKDDAQAA